MNFKFLNTGTTFLKILIFVLLIPVGGCKKNSTPPIPGPNQVFMENTMFNPSSITVAVNATVTWTNYDNVGHNVTSDSGWFASATIDPGNSYSHQFTTAGTYNYHCTIHQGMNGTVIVH